MSKVAKLPRREAGLPPSDKIGLRLIYAPDRPQTDESCLGQLRWTGDRHDVVEALVITSEMEVGRTGKPRRRVRKFAVDSMLEGARLVFRVSGWPQVELSETPNGMVASLPTVTAGSPAGTVRAA